MTVEGARPLGRGEEQRARSRHILRAAYRLFAERGAEGPTLDLAGSDRFALIVGHDGDVLAHAAERATEAFDIILTVCRIGIGLDYA